MAPILSVTRRQALGITLKAMPYKAPVMAAPKPKVKRARKGGTTAVVKPKAPKGVVDSCGNRVMPLDAAQRAYVDRLPIDSTTLRPVGPLLVAPPVPEWSVSGLGAYRSFRSHPNKSFATSRAVNYRDPGRRVDASGQDMNDHDASDAAVKATSSDHPATSL